jgi:hypothetical protein
MPSCENRKQRSRGLGSQRLPEALSDIVFGHKIVVECLKLSEREVLYAVLNGADELVAAAVGVG